MKKQNRMGLLALCTLGFATGSSASDTGWQARYSGDLNGSISGSIVVPGGTSMVAMVRGTSMSQDMRSVGTQAMSAKVMSLPGQEPSLMQLELTLADGTSCKLTPDGREQIEMRDTSKESYDISLSGTLKCDGGKTITADVTAKK